MTSAKRQQGFVLITGLIFLVVITLLALSSLGSATLQEKMATNQREKARAQEAAEAALRDGELYLSLKTRYPIPSDDTAIWTAGAPTPLSGTSDPGNVKAFLDPASWAPNREPATLRPRLFGQDTSGTLLPDRQAGAGNLPAPRYFIEDFDFRPDSLSFEDRSKLIGDKLYRLTGRAEGGTPSATVVVQSIYRKRFN